MRRVEAPGGGALVSLAGIDGAGKTTQVARLAEALRARGRDVVCCRTELWATRSVFRLAEAMTGDPSAYHPLIPAPLREFAIACDILAYADNVLSTLRRPGRILIWDRGPLCYRAYAAAYGGDSGFVTRMHDLLPQPSVTILLDVPAPIAHERIRARPEKPPKRDEDETVLADVREKYLALARHTPGCAIVDGTGAPCAVTEAVAAIVEPVLEATARDAPDADGTMR